MKEKTKSFPFEKFPRKDLHFDVPRRRFLSAILDEMQAHEKLNHGGDVQRLSQLGVWTNEQLATVVPKVKPGTKITIQDGAVMGTPAGKSEKIQLFLMDSPALAVFNSFNGTNTLAGVSRFLISEYGWDGEPSFEYARGLFLALVVVGICQPKYSIDE